MPNTVDLLASRGELPELVHLVDLQRVPEPLASRIALTGEVVLDDDRAQQVRCQIGTRKRHLDEVFRRDVVVHRVDTERLPTVLGRTTSRLVILEEYAEAFRLRARPGLLEDPPAAWTAGSVGCRKTLVHGYAEADNLAHLPAVRGFVRAMTTLLDA